MAGTPWQESIEFWKAKYEAEERARRGAEAQLAEGRGRAAALEAGAAEAAQRWEAMRGFQAALLGLRDRVDTLPFSALPAPEKLKLKQQIADLRRLLRHLPVAAGDGPGDEPPGASEEAGRTSSSCPPPPGLSCRCEDLAVSRAAGTGAESRRSPRTWG